MSFPGSDRRFARYQAGIPGINENINQSLLSRSDSGRNFAYG